ncbi:uncharacterized protein LY89DRAFT_787077 [Mollisia scopiformis]|uniref:BTB domain-containing protein n=1 Tax=Mollisia scopiformis TaxID=149040 RepID=A0A194WSS5_MOLSC|nr:uncharacterized protein LY89DRAFT_787077 [Mollisia scopiformis]KUJ10672.1 hypothetical protein LY89DRAFT_787077 [Mollisia scopiformis]
MANTALSSSLPSTFADDLGKAFVEINVGEDDQISKSYTVHKAMLLAQCSHIRTMVKIALFGGPDQIFWLEEDAGAVALLVAFLYKGSVPVFDERNGKLSASSYTQCQRSKTLVEMPKIDQSLIDAFDDIDRTDIVEPPWLAQAFEIDEEERLKSVERSNRERRRWMALHRPSITVPANLVPVEADDDINHYQTTLLRLCFLAEKIPWPKLFNASIKSYIEGEARLCRLIPTNCVLLIYEHTAAGSKLRDMVLDVISTASGKANVDMATYTAYAQKNRAFMTDVFARLSGPKFEFESVLEAADDGVNDLLEKAEGERTDGSVAVSGESEMEDH